MSKPRVFVSRVIPSAGLNKIRHSCDAEIWPEQMPPPYAVLKAKLADCEGLLSMLTEAVNVELLDAAPHLKVVSNYAVGFNNIDVPACTVRGIAVGNTPGVLTDATADFAFSLMCAAARHVVAGDRYVREGKWKTWEPRGHRGRELFGATIGIIGMGRIGYAMAYRCARGFDMKVLYHDQHRNEKAEEDLGAQFVDMDTLLSKSDFVSVHCDLNDTTRGLMNAEAFRKMKPTAVYINDARGAIHDQRALYEALRDGEISAAGIDVSDPEPIAMDDPLLTLPNVVISPHIASATFVARDRMATIAADNLLAGLKGEPLPAPVNPEVRREA